MKKKLKKIFYFVGILSVIVLPVLSLFNLKENNNLKTNHNNNLLSKKLLKNNSNSKNRDIVVDPKEEKKQFNYFQNILNKKTYTKPINKIYKSKKYSKIKYKKNLETTFSGLQDCYGERYSEGLSTQGYLEDSIINLDGNILGKTSFYEMHNQNYPQMESTNFEDVDIDITNMSDYQKFNFTSTTEKRQKSTLTAFNIGDIKNKFQSTIEEEKKKILQENPKAKILSTKLKFNKIYYDQIHLIWDGTWYHYYGVDGIYNPTIKCSLEIEYENWTKDKLYKTNKTNKNNKTNDTIKPLEIKLDNLDKIIISKDNLNSLKENKIKEISRKVFEGIKKNNKGKGNIFDLDNGSSFEYMKNDKEEIIFYYHIKMVNDGYIDYLDIKFNPFEIINNEQILKASSLSSTKWEHAKDGTEKYHINPPETKVRINENYLKALRIEIEKQDLLNKIKADNSWHFKNKDLDLAIMHIKDGSLNNLNYEEIKKEYLSGKRSSVFSNLELENEIKNIIYINNWNYIIFSKEQINNYLYSLQNMHINIQYWFSGEKYKSVKRDNLFTFNNLNSQSIFSLNKKEKNLPFDLNTNLKYFIFYNEKYKSLNTNFLKWEKPNYDSWRRLHDVSFSNSKDNLILIHNYLYQTNPTNIGDDISFSLKDGSIIDQDFKYLKNTQNHKKGDFAYDGIRYFGELKNHNQEMIYLIKKQNRYFSTKYNEYIENLVKSFDKRNLEFVFKNDINMYINPYILDKPLAPGVITAKTKQKFGIKWVKDEVDGHNITLEDWTDGKWSHAHTEEGFAKFDGIFGSDINGFNDPCGRLSKGTHKISISLFQQNIKNMNLKYKITINPEMKEIETEGTIKKIDYTLIHYLDENGNEVSSPLYISNGPLHFQVMDMDIKKVEGLILDSSGKWWKMPISIINKKINGKWTHYVNSTMNYAGFAKITFISNVGNKKTIFLEAVANPDVLSPNLAISKELELLQKKSIFYKGQRVRVVDFDKAKSLKNQLFINDPLVKNFEIEKVEFDNQGKEKIEVAKEGKDFNKSKREGIIKKPKDYRFGKVLDGSKTPLRFIVDELSPMFDPLTDKALEKKWSMSNYNINFLKEGLYKIKMFSNIDLKKEFISYVQVVDKNNSKINKTIFINQTKKINDLKSHLKGSFSLNNDKKSKEEIDIDKRDILIGNRFNLCFPEYLIDSLNVKYSLLWYTDFYDVDFRNLDSAFSFKNEGKYIIEIKDLFKNTYKINILLIDPEKKRGKWNHLAIPEKEKFDSLLIKENFFSGNMIWDGYRYEDKEHLKWEQELFIKEALSKKIPKEKALEIYHKLKKNPFWGGEELDFEVFGDKVINPDWHWKKGHWEIDKDGKQIWVPPHWETEKEKEQHFVWPKVIPFVPHWDWEKHQEYNPKINKGKKNVFLYSIILGGVACLILISGTLFFFKKKKKSIKIIKKGGK